jgi:hypothetical protein
MIDRILSFATHNNTTGRKIILILNECIGTLIKKLARNHYVQVLNRYFGTLMKNKTYSQSLCEILLIADILALH